MKMCYVQDISVYMNLGGYGGGCTYSTVHFLFIVKKKGKSTRAWPILNQILHHFDLKKKFLGLIIKILWKGWSQGPGSPDPISLRSEYSSSNWFHSNTPKSRYLFNTNNTNVYLIDFHNKNNIQMRFPKNRVFKVSN